MLTMQGEFPPLPLTSQPIMRPIRASEVETMTVNQLTAGTITAQEIILASDGADLAIIRSDSYVAGASGWYIDSDGNAEFNDVTVRGDLLGAWNGDNPVDLSSGPDTGATEGFAWDASEGKGQVSSDFYVGGDIQLLSAGLFSTRVTGASGDRVDIGGSTGSVQFKNTTNLLGAILGTTDTVDILRFIDGGNLPRLDILAGDDIRLYAADGSTVVLQWDQGDSRVEIGTTAFTASVSFVGSSQNLAMAGNNINMGNGSIVNLPAPTASGHAARKLYVDDAIAAHVTAYH